MVALQNKKIVIAGGSGFIGTSLATHLVEQGADVIVLSRRQPQTRGSWRCVLWDGRSVDSWTDELPGAAGLINLAGRSVDCVKTPDNQDEILRSRVESTTVLGKAVQLVENPPPVWIQMSTAHIYGDSPNVTCTEESAFGYGLAPFVGQAWEDAFHEALPQSLRGVILRTSFVIGRNRGAGCGALGKLATLARIGLGGRVGSGKQGISWIHELDLNRLIERALTDSRMKGAYIASAPHPVPQVQFMRELRRAVKMPIGLPAFNWMVRFGARFLLKTDPDLALYGRFVVSQRLKDAGFAFQLAHLREALQYTYSAVGPPPALPAT